MAHVAVFGLGKLGGPLAAALATAGHEVVGVDLAADVVKHINDGRAPVYEPGLGPLIKKAGPRLTATQDGSAAVGRSDVSFVIVPTPSLADGTFALDGLLNVVASVGRALARSSQPYHLVVITSTVMPGAMAGPIRATLERESGRTLGPTLGLCYNPEFVALGSVIRDTLRPDLLLIGESDALAGDRLLAVLDPLYEPAHRPAVHRMNFVNAELTKLAVNTLVTTKISYANMLARICEAVPDASVDTVTAALGADSRIGPHYLQGSVSYGGPCFPRDNVAFVAMAKAIGMDASLAEATHAINRRQIEHLTAVTLEHLPTGGRVAILGMAYKPGTDVCEESAGLHLAQALATRGIPVTVVDPAAIPAARQVLGDAVSYGQTARAGLATADVGIITVPWKAFVELTAADVPYSRPLTLIDCWRVLERGALPPNVRVVRLGDGPVAAQRP